MSRRIRAKRVAGVPGWHYGRGQDFGAAIDNFDPNAIKQEPWATFIPRPRGAFEQHPDRGAALRALNPRYVSYGILYRWEPPSVSPQYGEVGGHWVEVARLDGRKPIPHNCDGCGIHKNNQPPINPDSAWPYSPTHLTVQWMRRTKRGKLLDPPRVGHLCHQCAYGDRLAGKRYKPTPVTASANTNVFIHNPNATFTLSGGNIV
jgi:hypothetical protein